jgi:diaminopimelate epimerase
VAQPAALARAISDRHTGIGSDGLILIGPSQQAEVRMEMYNADGSRGLMCGNGIRCVAKYALERNLARGPEVRIETDSGVKTVWCEVRGGEVRAVRVNMGPPILAPERIPVLLSGDQVVDRPIEAAGRLVRVTCVSMGNPHVIVFTDDLEGIDLKVEGSAIENSPLFPDRTNVHFVYVDSRTHVTMKTWERGSGATRACGTGACAVGVAGVLNDRTGRKITATLPGGDLEIEWEADGDVYMTGPAVEVFNGEWPDDRLARRHALA